jgi:hypothetical protein
MTDQEKNKPPQKLAAEMDNEDFQFVLKALVEAYQPILEQQLSLAENPQELQKEAENMPPNCANEIAEANSIFGKFFTADVALRMIPAENRNQLGPIENWRWCLQHLRCCVIFGWLVCRGPRTFRAWAYYVYQYWLCVRESLGTPVANPPTEAQRQDFRTLVSALAVAYKPYLTDQLASVEFPAGIPDEVLNGQIDCFEGQQDVCTIFDRLLTTDAAQALLGKEAFAARSKDPNFWFCRCWCLCAICFGCCLARARSFNDVYWCLVYFFRCLAECFQPIHCDITAPTGCAVEQPNLPGIPPGDVGLEIDGTAAGAFFDHYTLEWRQAATPPLPCSDSTGWSTLGISYPGGGATGATPVVAGTLGWLDTTFLTGGFPYEIRLTVYATSGAQVCQFCIQFTLFADRVWIDHVADAAVQWPPGWFDLPAPPQAQLVDFSGNKVPVGGCVTVKGSAWVGSCPSQQIACVDLRAAVGWQPGTAEPGFAASLPFYTTELLSPGPPPGVSLGPICYTDSNPLVEWMKRAGYNEILAGTAITRCWNLVGPSKIYYLWPCCTDSSNLLPGCPDINHHCHSGKYTLLLDVTDTLGNHYYDTQQVWFDNKQILSNIHVAFSGIAGLASCTDLHLGAPNTPFVPAGAPCGVPWPANLLGVAYDEFIDPADTTSPSDNFDYYTLSITRQGGPTLTVPIAASLVSLYAAYAVTPPPATNAFNQGTQRVGDPGTRCEVLAPIPLCPAPAIPPMMAGLLTQLDMRVFDAVCAASVPGPSTTPPGPYDIPPGFPLERGTCCGYSFQVYLQDKTWSDGYDGGYHYNWSSPWAVCICNDLPASGS